MNKRNLLLFFAAVAAAQLAVPAWLIIERELTLREGQAFKFKTRPVDPYDAFRGRYVMLGLEPASVKVADTAEWQYRQKAYAVLGTNEAGFACVQRLEQAKPKDGPAVLVHVGWADTKAGIVHITWPSLDRYYMTESKAPQAESAYWAHSTRTNQACHVTVRVRGTRAVIENLFIENQPVLEWLRNHPAKK